MLSDVAVREVPAKPVFIFDGECGFCRRWVERWRALAGESVEFRAAPDERFPELPGTLYAGSSVFINTDGRVYFGAEAVFRMLAHARGRSPWLWAYRRWPAFQHVSEWVYRRVAANRSTFSRLDPILGWNSGPDYAATATVFLRLLGVVYLCAFVSLWTQVHGLIGSHGILPVAELIDAAGQQLAGSARWHQLPTFCWLSARDLSLTVQCALGTLCALALVLGLFPAMVLPALWLLWLSLTVAGQEFMGFQWENLLLESGFLAIFLPSLAWRCARGGRPSRIVIFFFRWLLFRFMFESGMVKLLSGDPVWRDLSALSYHFETQPLPTLLAWHAAKWPELLLRIQSGVMFAIELGLPFLVFGTLWMRVAAFVGFVALQLGIALTGNYGYFNLLTAVLSVLLLDDKVLRPRAPNLLPHPPGVALARIQLARSLAFGAAAIVIAILSCSTFFAAIGLQRHWSKPVLALYSFVEPFRSVNSYGLFAVMTKTRPEIIVQGSDDGEHWRDYRFKYKPGDLNRPPRFVAPHQPRLDWQMWFAALGTYQENRWFIRFCVRLLEGAPEVLNLLETNPFAGRPPRLIRAIVYDYKFTSQEERKRTGEYWRRGEPRVYLPPLSMSPVPVGGRK